MQMKLVFLGPPGAGKGTQAVGVCERYSIPGISTGNILREEVKEGTALGKEAKTYMDAGKLVPDTVVIGMVSARLQKDDCKNGYLLDGFPRTLAQAEALAKEVTIDIAINLQVPDENIIQRLSGRRVCKDCGATYHVDTLNGANACASCGGELIIRDDDKPETIKKRLDVYNEQTSPLIDYYGKQGILHNVGGTGSIEDVFAAICAVIDGAKK